MLCLTAECLVRLDLHMSAGQWPQKSEEPGQPLCAFHENAFLSVSQEGLKESIHVDSRLGGSIRASSS